MPAPLSVLLDRWRRDLDPPLPGRVVVAPSARAYIAAATAKRLGRPLLVVVAGDREAEDLTEDVSIFTDDVIQLPAWETLPFEHVSPNVVTMATRLEARYRLAREAPVVVVASVRAVTQRLSPTRVAPLTLRQGESYDFTETVSNLVYLGYKRVERAEARGDVAVRGGIVDVFPPNADDPFRLDFWGDTLDEIRTYSPVSQRSDDIHESVAIFPARELIIDENVQARARELVADVPWAAETWERIAHGITFQGMESWLPWLAPPRTLLDETEAPVFLFDPVQCASRAADLIAEEADLARALAGTWGSESPHGDTHPSLYLPLDVELVADRLIEAPPQPSGPGDHGYEVRTLDAVAGDPDSVARAVNTWKERGVDIVIAMDGQPAADRVASILTEHGTDIPVTDRLEGRGVAITSIGIHLGFVLPALGFGVVGEREVAGRRRAHRTARGGGRAPDTDPYRDLNPGDHIVHRHHGIGRFTGLVQRDIAGVERDYLLVVYAGEDKLYVPTDQLASITKYTGGESPRLSKMGGTDWSQTRSRVRAEVAVVADNVVALHRKRAEAEGFAFAPDTPWQSEFEAAFPYEETPDQLKAIHDVKADMEMDSPMDRLIFGDVGFGKTEVAIRAMFKAIQDGRQVAMLVPTTLLAQQHFANFEERFAPYPVRVEMLSRFLTPKQQRDVISGIKDGSVDLVVGTHRLLSSDIDFRSLGLVVIDEEQRFGVAAKDTLRELRASVDVLTLTATPIPRTLEMVLTGIRDVSSIRTPPQDRHPILTYVGPYDERAVAAAIRREILREGQVYFVHNRVQSIDHAVARLRDLVPNARFAVAHGQMSEGRLEQVMYDFWNHEYDVLVSTTIIESGLDLPQVNTMIVERADRLGLAQIYQLRGRIGRSNRRAYAYLFHPTDDRITETAFRRLEAIGEFSNLGSGFELAMRDLEIRGAGSILSETQSGHIAAVGIDLYTELVADAVKKLKGDTPSEPDPEPVRIDLHADAHLPDDYVPGVEGRLEAYRRLASGTSHDAVDDVVVEWEDRYGTLPEGAVDLIDAARLRVEALRLGISEIVQNRREVRIAPVTLKTSQEVRLKRLAPGALLRGSTLYLPPPEESPATAIAEFLRTMWPAPTDPDGTS
ncbi:MAG: transcription-repair coupling factor [Actinomycetota bacterium]|nr:transcription-repair coupling factor [Actinomycetota bacterium]MDK1026890.1 transcription-repair coupling factor [Actinomycetota bacterium]MDK1038167.1 transcription-repair coupling factor [Actinomycetota bacterium]MDK1096683.1 transcription-repair coupling factor [Actinomycetota bacterium]MDK1103492.1 transcription-repair coupling factor [Actinomycetota bacterium]